MDQQRGQTNTKEMKNDDKIREVIKSWCILVLDIMELKLYSKHQDNLINKASDIRDLAMNIKTEL